jgi:hypothetical protein
MAIQTVSWNAEVPIVAAPNASGLTFSLISGGPDLSGELFTVCARANTFGQGQGEGASVLPASAKAVAFDGLNRKAVIRGIAPSLVSTQTSMGLSIGPGQLEWMLFASSSNLTIADYDPANSTSRQLPGFQLRNQAWQLTQGWAANGVYHPAEIEIPRSTRFLYALARGWYGNVRSTATPVATGATQVEVYSAALTLQIDV